MNLIPQIYTNKVSQKLFEELYKLAYQAIILGNHDSEFISLIINAYNKLNQTNIIICNINDNKQIGDLLLNDNTFTTEIISELYNDSKLNNMKFFFYQKGMDMSLIAMSSLGEIKSVIIDNLPNIIHTALTNQTQQPFQRIYNILMKSILV